MRGAFSFPFEILYCTVQELLEDWEKNPENCNEQKMAFLLPAIRSLAPLMTSRELRVQTGGGNITEERSLNPENCNIRRA
jgi:hypothetical protein